MIKKRKPVIPHRFRFGANGHLLSNGARSPPWRTLVVLAILIVLILPLSEGSAQSQAPATDATLSALSLSGITLTPTFAAAATTYTATVDYAVEETDVTPTTNHAGAGYVIKLGGVIDAAGSLGLAEGDNVITVEVTAEDGATTQTYTVTVTRQAPGIKLGGVIDATDATLSALSLSGITLTPTFAAAATTYRRRHDGRLRGGGDRRYADDQPRWGRVRDQVGRRDRRRRVARSGRG